MVLDPDDWPDASAGELHALADVIDEVDAETEYEAQAAYDESLAQLEEMYDGHQLRAAQDELAGLEDAEEAAMASRGSSEARLQRALGRIGTGSYLPGDERGPLNGPGGVTGHGTCGPADDLGYCLNSSHEPECGALATSEMGEALAASGAYAERMSRPWLDASGDLARTRDGSAARLADVIEAQAGVRLHGDADLESGWGRPEVTTVAREDWPGEAATIETVAAVRDHMGLQAGPSAREIGAERVARRAQNIAYGVRPGDGSTETARERAARYAADVTPGSLRQVDEPVAGSLGTYRA